MSLYLTDDWITTHQCWFVDVESRELALWFWTANAHVAMYLLIWSFKTICNSTIRISESKNLSKMDPTEATQNNDEKSMPIFALPMEKDTQFWNMTTLIYCDSSPRYSCVGHCWERPFAHFLAPKLSLYYLGFLDTWRMHDRNYWLLFRRQRRKTMSECDEPRSNWNNGRTSLTFSPRCR